MGVVTPCFPSGVNQRDACRGISRVEPNIYLCAGIFGCARMPGELDALARVVGDQRLLAALDFRITRWLLTGLWKPLHEETVEEIDAFLNNWSQSSIGRFNLAYRTLTRLLASNWFAMPANYRQSNYPGPPSWAAETSAIAKV